MTSGQPNLDYNVGFGFVPARQSLIDQFKKTSTDKIYLRSLDEAQYGGIEKAPGLWDAWAIVEPMIQAALLGKMTPEAALKQASDQIDSQVLSKYPGAAAG
jgi:maltose-binding protein MalE